jgi:TonB-linked SusC/RagA family outer membrane protein
MKNYLNTYWRQLFFLCLLVTISNNLLAVNEYSFIEKSNLQEKIIEGTVIDEETDTPIPSVNISIKGTKLGTTTDFDGNFILKVKETDVLVFTYLGYKKQVVSVAGKTGTKIKVKMVIASDQLDEITVVAYGYQKKESVVASITTVKPAELKVPASNLTASFSGRIPGLIAFQETGEPGADNSQFFIRGVTTFGYRTSPLILIDGLESSTDDLARIDVNDIDSFSIMKDASASALYGSRGANGVILVNTKEGKEGKAKLSFNYETSYSSNVKDVEYADPVTYMQLWNEAAFTNRNDGSVVEFDVFSQNKIDNVINKVNPYAAPATDWSNLLFKDFAINQRVSVNVSGGGKTARYHLSGTYTRDTGILNVDDRSDFNTGISLNKIQIRSNNNINITPSLAAKVQVYLALDDYTGPLGGAASIFDKVRRTSPSLYPAFYEPDAANSAASQILFGNYGEGANYINPYAESLRGYREYSKSKFTTQINLTQKITEDLSARVKIAYDLSSFFENNRDYDPFYYNVQSFDKFSNTYVLEWLNEDKNPEDALDFQKSTTDVSPVFYAESAINYSKDLNDKNRIGASFIGTIREELSNSATDLQSSLAKRNLGLAGRLTYAYDSKYFLEFNFGYNGSERFSSEERFGFFPTIGGAWTTSKEKFWKPLENVINKLRFRWSYGLVGNDAIGSASDRFFYLSNIQLNDSNRSARFGEEFGYSRSGVSTLRYANDAITWETARKLNLAADISLFNNQIDITAEYFTDVREDIFLRRTEVPSALGLTTDLFANSGRAKSEGFEFSIRGKHQFNKDFWIQTVTNFTYATSEYLAYDEPDYSATPWRTRIGKPIRQTFGYVAERLFFDEFDVSNSPRQFGIEQNTYAGYGPGDLKYKDINQDGVINESDQVPIGHPTTPEINYGFGFTIGYKNWDFNCFFNGVGKKSFFIDSAKTASFYQFSSGGQTSVNQLLDIYANDHWSEENRDPYALYPRLTHEFVQNNRVASTWWMRDGSYLRLQQVELGYTLPKDFIKRTLPAINDGRFYISGRNLLTISKFDLWDVSLSGNPYSYPVQKVVNFGFRVNF